MPLKDLLKKKDRVRTSSDAPEKGPTLSPDVPEFQFYRSTTTTRESIEPPAFPGDPQRETHLAPEAPRSGLKGKLRRHSNAGQAGPGAERGKSDGGHKLHFGRSRSGSSVNVPQDLPEVGGDGVARNEEEEARWEKRATMLVEGTVLKSGGTTPTIEVNNPMSSGSRNGPSRSNSFDATAGHDPESPEQKFQDAIDLHKEGDFVKSTKKFGEVADTKGPNQALAEVLYGLALRHGWGCEVNQELGLQYLRNAASNSAEVERLALQAGMKKGGAAKGELTIAIFELGNCFRNGWGVKKDPVAAKQYYETAANLGDTDAMSEVAWCYVEGFGTKKDKFKAAQFLRLRESKIGQPEVGNSWIWKDKYNPK
ncbi:HCP-like protein [Bimuria novae-zelandiae CBS 107.79]|uniref:HCP-like protein n=1 Tax=Bimuria novae-zelandiae CBS 107.79 TaxID=1447943 RepID=A0A6A5VEJ3_9PLEO|nr:HCP-like protein [Bimuria novae-zelandiae CBS 107.79]